MSDIKKAVLAYSGGLDTSVILKWLQDTYQCEVVTFTADLGQGEELEPARKKALQFGIKPEQIFIDDLREEFVRDFVFPMFRCNTIYEGEYLLGTSIARPLIAKRQIEIAKQTGADAVSHGATGKGNDQVRFELGYYALEPNIKVIAPWREWDLLSREKLMAYAEQHGIPVDMKHKQGGSPYSMDANLLHISYEGRHLENPAAEAEESMWRWTVSPEAAPDAAEYLDIEFEKGDIVGLNGTRIWVSRAKVQRNRGVGISISNAKAGLADVLSTHNSNGVSFFENQTVCSPICNTIGHGVWNLTSAHNTTNELTCGAVAAATWRISNSILASWNNAAFDNGPGCALSYTHVYNAGVSGADPQFASSADFHLLSTSPCKNAGDPGFTPPSSAVDLEGSPRKFGPAVDQGAYELQAP